LSLFPPEDDAAVGSTLGEDSGAGGGTGSLDISDIFYYQSGRATRTRKHEMKPRIILAETRLADGSVLSLQEHDGRRYLQHDGSQVGGPAVAASGAELARLACAPFRPARQPKIHIVGLGLGELLEAVAAELPQKRGHFTVAEPSECLVDWQRRFFPDGVFSNDPRVERVDSADAPFFHQSEGTLHAVLLHADTAPLDARKRFLFEEARWLAAVHGALQEGGLLAIASSRPVADLNRRLFRSGFDVVQHELNATPKARRPRPHLLWLCRKGKTGERQR